MEQGALDYSDKIDALGGMVEAVEKGFPQREIQESAYQYQKAVERGEQMIVGVNKYAMDGGASEVPILVIDESVRHHQVERLEQDSRASRCRRRRQRARETKKGCSERTKTRCRRRSRRFALTQRSVKSAPRCATSMAFTRSRPI